MSVYMVCTMGTLLKPKYYVVYTNDINGEITVLRGTNFVTNLGLVTELTHEKWPAGGIEGMQSNAKIFW